MTTMHAAVADKIMTLPPGNGSAKRYPYGDGLYLQVTPGGGRSWLFRYDWQRKCRWMGLGPVDPGRLTESLATARGKARAARAVLAEGRNPLDEKRAHAANVTPQQRKTFAQAWDAYVAAHKDSWRSAVHARQWDQVARDYVNPKIGNLPVADVGPQDVKGVLKPLWKTRREVARKLCGKIGMVINLAIAEGWRFTANPANLRVMSTTLGKLEQKPKHHASMPYKDVPVFVRKLEARDDVPALALRWLILTATRSSEARCPTWDEIDMDRKCWRIPASRMKGGVMHDVPLSAGALEVLGRVKRLKDCPFVFVAQAGKPVSETALRNQLRDLGFDKDAATLHGFRSSFRDWAAETGVADDVAEFCIAHYTKGVLGTLSGSGASVATVRAYKRSSLYDARIDVMTKWDMFLRFG